MKIMLVAGARPNFMKIAPIINELRRSKELRVKGEKLEYLLVHTGQHYDDNMSKAFFDDLDLPRPDIYLGVGSGSHAEQTAKIMMKFEKVLLQEWPDVLMVVGDVNSTLACGIVAAKVDFVNSKSSIVTREKDSKLGTPHYSRPLIAHVEAGLRSFDRSMPEEINRIVTDSLSDLLFTTCEDANENLRKEGIPKDKICFVGNVMIDTLLAHREKAKKTRILEKLGLNTDSRAKPYALLTLHRPSNVDDREVFRNILEALQVVSEEVPIIFPAHPRTQNQIKNFGYQGYFNFLSLNLVNSINPKNSINLLDPLPYLEFLNLMANAKFVLTDSGGIQEETTILGIPCLTLRENTERPVTVNEGTNIIVGTNTNKIIRESSNILNGKGKIGQIPKLWDGSAAKRIISILFGKLGIGI